MARAVNEYALEELFELTTSEMVAYHYETGMPLYSATLKTSEIAKTVTNTPIRAGVNNATIMELKGDTELTITTTDVKIDRQLEAMKMGGSLEKREVVLSYFPKNYEVASNSITLTKTPNDVSELIIFDLDTNKPMAAEDFTVEGNVVTFTGTTNGKVVKVGSYLYTETTADVVDFSTLARGVSLRLELRTPLFDNEQNIKMYKQVVIYKASLGTDLTMTNSAEVSENPITTNFTALKDTKSTSDALGFVAYIPVVDEA